MTQNPPALENAHEDGAARSEHLVPKNQSALVTGEIAPGPKICEPERARTNGKSRRPQREAIQPLEGLRLLV
ncbi:GntR family transcriptional regulator, partial [Pseudomonas paraeruginosa]